MNKLLTVLALFISFSIAAQDDDSQEELRLNPEIENADTIEPVNYSDYPFIRLDNNKINLNGDDWSALAEKYKAAKEGNGRFNIVYLGDSHIQADFGGNVIRQRLARSSHYGGRGLIIPFRLAGTNQPNDYRFAMKSAFTSSKLMRTPWVTEMPFTGVGLQPQTREYTLNFSSADSTRSLRLHTRGTTPQPVALTADGKNVEFIASVDSSGLSVINIDRPALEFELKLKGDKSTVFGGIELIADTAGVMLHSIGNNGATFSSYTTIDRFGSELSALAPDLIIIALGTNEAFGNTSAATMQNNIDVLISGIRNYSPETKILLVGPTECYKRVYQRRKGKRRRVRTTVLNQKTATMAKAIRLFAEEQGIPYYNHYAVAGPASKMKTAKVLSRDGVHFTATGYRLWGNLLSDALLQHLQQ